MPISRRAFKTTQSVRHFLTYLRTQLRVRWHSSRQQLRLQFFDSIREAHVSLAIATHATQCATLQWQLQSTVPRGRMDNEAIRLLMRTILAHTTHVRWVAQQSTVPPFPIVERRIGATCVLGMMEHALFAELYERYLAGYPSRQPFSIEHVDVTSALPVLRALSQRVRNNSETPESAWDRVRDAQSKLPDTSSHTALAMLASAVTPRDVDSAIAQLIAVVVDEEAERLLQSVVVHIAGGSAKVAFKMDDIKIETSS